MVDIIKFLKAGLISMSFFFLPLIYTQDNPGFTVVVIPDTQF